MATLSLPNRGQQLGDSGLCREREDVRLSFARLQERCIIFDWDDTLLPSSFIEDASWPGVHVLGRSGSKSVLISRSS